MSPLPPTWSGDARIAAILDREVRSPGVSSWSAAFVGRDGEGAWGAIAEGSVVAPSFDLASLTKPLTATVALAEVSRGALELHTTLGEVLPELAHTPAAQARLDALLAHRAGLHAHGVLYRDDPFAFDTVTSVPMLERPRLRDLLERAASRVDAAPGVYSDLGYVLVGAMLARRFGPLTAQRRAWTGLGGAPADLACVGPTEDVPWRGGVVRGRVHDENAFALEEAGGDAGHAGAFGTAEQVGRFGQAWLAALAGDGPIAKELAEQAIAPHPEGGRGLGWDHRSGPDPSSGRAFGPRTFGHLGFTGTSLWIDPDQRLVVALLTNRVHPTRTNDAIRRARPRVHDALAELSSTGPLWPSS